MFSITSTNFVESCSFAELNTIDTGREWQSTATCIFVPEILLNPSYPIMSPLFWKQLMMNQLIFFPGSTFLVCVQIWLHLTESFAILFFAASFAVWDVQLICYHIFLAFHSTCIHKSKRRWFHWWLYGHHILVCQFWQVVEDAFVSYSIVCLIILDISWNVVTWASC